MLVKSTKMRKLRQSKNWTQQHLAEVCGLSMRTIQRVENDGVASNETVAAYAAVFELAAVDLLTTVEEFERGSRAPSGSRISSSLVSLIFLGGMAVGIAAGVGLALYLF